MAILIVWRIFYKGAEVVTPEKLGAEVSFPKGAEGAEVVGAEVVGAEVSNPPISQGLLYSRWISLCRRTIPQARVFTLNCLKHGTHN